MGTIPQDLLDLLADPETHTPLRLAGEEELSRLQQAVREGRAKRRDGQVVRAELEGALLAQGGRVAYLIEDGIPNLLIDERLELASGA